MVKNGFLSIEQIMKETDKIHDGHKFFINALVTSDIFVVSNLPIKNKALDKITLLNFSLMKNQNGLITIPFFTSIEALRIHNTSADYYNMKGLDFFRLVKGHNATLNPGSDTIEFSAKEIMDILSNDSADKKTDKFLSQGTSEIKYEKPEQTPMQLIKALVGFFEKHDKVKTAYFSVMKKENFADRLLLIVESSGSYRKLFNQISRTIEKELTGEPLMMLSYETELAKKIIDGYIPFYRKLSRHRTDNMEF